MTPQRYEKVRGLFVEVCDLEPLERSAVLDERCASDSALRDEVESLLMEELGLDERLKDSRLCGLTQAMRAALHDQRGVIPQSLGKYRLISKLGEGGMGSVYEAEQDHPKRRVAVKIVRPGLVSEALLKRFSHEVQVLALLKHPGIAQIHDAGAATTDHGPQPYFVMELVRGQPLLVFSAEMNLSTRERLELMAQIADAVHHAHTRGVVHRDLKPANILIDESSGVPQPKILDFGVARATESDLAATTLHTDIGQLVGTIPYMSPEQASGDPAEIDTRSDVYSLGVVCFELLTGRLPHDLKRAKVHEAARMIRDEEPARLSGMDRALRGDVDTVVAKALEKDKERRYQSAADFAADIRRYLNDEPITARPASTMYQLRKFTRRNKALVGTVLGMIVALAFGIAATGYWLAEAIQRGRLAHEAQQVAEKRLQQIVLAQQTAEREAAKATVVREFIESMLESLDPKTAQGLDRRLMQQMLETAARRLDTELNLEPEIQARLHGVVGRTYQSIGEWPKANVHLERAFELDRLTLGEHHPVTLRAINDLAALYLEQDQYQLGESLLREVVSNQERVLGSSHADTLMSRSNLATCCMRAGRYDEAAIHLNIVITTAEQNFGASHKLTLEAYASLAALALEQGQYDRAEEISQDLLRRHRAQFGSTDPRTLDVNYNLALLYFWTERLEQAEPIIRELDEVCPRIFGDDHLTTLNAKNLYATLLTNRGQYDEAEKLHLEILDRKRRILSPHHQSTLATIGNLSLLYESWGNLPEAERVMRELWELCKQVDGEHHPGALAAASHLARIQIRQDKTEEAAHFLQAVLTEQQRALGAEHPDVLTTMADLAIAYARSGRPEQAAELFEQQLTMCRSLFGNDHPRTVRAIRNLARAYVDCGRMNEAEPYYLERLETDCRKFGEKSQQAIASRNDLATLYYDLGRHNDAIRMLQEMYDICREAADSTPGNILAVAHELCTLLIENKHFERAERILLQVQAEHEGSDQQQLLGTFIELYEAWGQAERAIECRQKLEQLTNYDNGG